MERGSNCDLVQNTSTKTRPAAPIKQKAVGAMGIEPMRSTIIRSSELESDARDPHDLNLNSEFSRSRLQQPVQALGLHVDSGGNSGRRSRCAAGTEPRARSNCNHNEQAFQSARLHCDPGFAMACRAAKRTVTCCQTRAARSTRCLDFGTSQKILALCAASDLIRLRALNRAAISCALWAWRRCDAS